MAGRWRFTKRFARRAVLRGTMAGAVAAGVTRLLSRSRPSPAPAAAAGAAVAAAALEFPVAAPLVAAGAAVVGRRAAGRGHSPRALAAAAAGGAAVSFATRYVWPVAPEEPAQLRRALGPVEVEPAPTGKGVAIVVNPEAGPAMAKSPTEDLLEALPDADVIEVDEATNLLDALRRAVDGSNAIGVAGGDGTVNAGAAAAVNHDLPLMVIPAGTLNHLARDLGLVALDDAIEAVRHGDAGAMDVGEFDVGDGDTRVFLNTASFGSYAELVDARERLESTIGKWPALIVALVRVLRRSSPIEVEMNGRRRKLWMIFIGNCRYHPHGFAPSWRERLDDGQLDVRVLDGTQPWARLRLVLAVLTGTLGRSRVYEEFSTDRLQVRSLDGPLRLARDGETFDGPPEFEVRKRSDRLAVFVPSRSD